MTIEGIEELQAINRHMIEALKPANALGRAIRFAALEGQDYLVSIIHRDTRAYAAAQRIAIDQGGSRATLYTDPTAVNQRGQRPAEYGPYEEARGGSHAAYARLVRERGEKIAARALKFIDKSLIWQLR
jgi:hypothetical protein